MGEHGGGDTGRGRERMNAREVTLDALRRIGKERALDLRGRGAELDGTAVIAEELYAPAFDPAKDYSGWPVGAPVRDGEQVYKLLQPHNASTWPDQCPADLPALWSICHTKDPERAKPYMAPNGTSGMYMTGECCTEDGVTYRSTIDNNVWPPADYPQGWEAVQEEST